ncbi:MAG: sulfatase [Pirellulales bacterium]
MNRLVPAALILLALAASLPPGVAAAEHPNVIVILVDDLGWADLGCTGSKLNETPHLDRLAADGVRFTQAYSACTVCSPTRAALLTGKYPARLHLTDWIAGHPAPQAKLLPPEWTKRLPLEETTLAETLRAAGYATAAIGKWHLGGEGFGPREQGFDENHGGDHRGQPPSYVSPYRLPQLTDGPAGEFLTDRECDEAAKFIRAHREQPFFVYLAHYAVHQPIAGKAEVVAKYRAKAPELPPARATYAALLESVDDSVGRIRQTLEELGLSGRTLIVFTSDNGGLSSGDEPTTDNAPLRAGKGSPYEGGVRVPLLVTWPGHVKAGLVDDTPVASIDVFPTVAELADVSAPAGLDGRSLAPLLTGQGRLEREALFWHYPHYHLGNGRPYGAVRSGNLKLIQYDEDGHLELFDLESDPGEASNVANQRPAESAALAMKLADWRKEVGAQLPTPNPNYDPAADEPPSHVVRTGADGAIVLPASRVEIHGDQVRYEPQPHKNTVGYWTKASDWVSWDFVVEKPGKYEVEILQGCGPGSGGSQVAFEAAAQALEIAVIETRGFQDFLARKIGAFEFEKPGRYRLTVRPQKKPGVAVMDLREVTLRPAD